MEIQLIMRLLLFCAALIEVSAFASVVGVKVSGRDSFVRGEGTVVQLP